MRVQEVLSGLAEVNLTINLAKSEFGHDEVVFLGHMVGNGQIKPLVAKVQSILHQHQKGTNEVSQKESWDIIDDSIKTFPLLHLD